MTADLQLLVLAAALLLVSGVPGLFAPRRATWSAGLAAGIVVAGAVVGLIGAVRALAAEGVAEITYPSMIPGLTGRLGLDAISAFFCLPALVVGAAGAIYGLGYWRPEKHLRHGRRLRFCYGLLVASLILVPLARDGASFLLAWELMTMATFFLVTTEEDVPSVRRAGWMYLLFAHVSILALLAMFLLWSPATPSPDELAIAPLAAGAPHALAVFVLALLGFGIKAGLMPVHSWLPEAHAAAPSHVSALMSGVVIKMGIYGLVRVASCLPTPPASWAATLLLLGAVSALFGVVFALGQHDIKRLLAYHSIENIGIIVLGLGMAQLGRALDRPDWVVLGLAGCLLHTWNHALFKPLLFMGAGAVVHAAGTRDLERTGGLAHRMPWTAACFLLGAVAICGLPPLNGFVSELLVYLSLLRTAVGDGPSWLPAALAAPVLAAVGALAVACFVKVYGIVFLGTARTAAAAAAHEVDRTMRGPMFLLATACVAIGGVPWTLAPMLDRVVRAWTEPAGAPKFVEALPKLTTLAPLHAITLVALLLLVVTALAATQVLPAARRARRRLPAVPTWDCGYAVASPRLQYTASSFADLIVSRFAWLLRPQVQTPRLSALIASEGTFETHGDDPLVRELFLPLANRVLRLAARLRASHQGQMQRYLAYLLLTLAALVAWSVWVTVRLP